MEASGHQAGGSLPTPSDRRTPEAPEGVSLSFLLGPFADATARHGVDWTLPRRSSEWRRRLSSADGPRLSATSLPGAQGGHTFLPALFAPGPAGYGGPFELVRVRVVGVLMRRGAEPVALGAWRRHIGRDTLLLAAPLDAAGVVRQELAVEATAGDLCLRKTRELVYNYIGDGRTQGVTSLSKATYMQWAKREASGGGAKRLFGPADAFLSHSWSVVK